MSLLLDWSVREDWLRERGELCVWILICGRRQKKELGLDDVTFGFNRSRLNKKKLAKFIDTLI